MVLSFLSRYFSLRLCLVFCPFNAYASYMAMYYGRASICTTCVVTMTCFLAHGILHHTFSIGLVFMATESPKMLVYYIPVSLNYSHCFRCCLSVAQSSVFYCPNRAVSTKYYRLKMQRKFCVNL